ncbi:MAG: hypothetical protein QM729_21320 [Solirubrobacterales bacterium]
MTDDDLEGFTDVDIVYTVLARNKVRIEGQGRARVRPGDLSCTTLGDSGVLSAMCAEAGAGDKLAEAASLSILIGSATKCIEKWSARLEELDLGMAKADPAMSNTKNEVLN